MPSNNNSDTNKTQSTIVERKSTYGRDCLSASAFSSSESCTSTQSASCTVIKLNVTKSDHSDSIILSKPKKERKRIILKNGF